MWSAWREPESERIIVIHGHKKQRLAVREGGAGPGVQAPGPALALSAGGLWLPPCTHMSGK